MVGCSRNEVPKHVQFQHANFVISDFDGAMPGVLRFGKRGGVWEKRESSVQKKEMPGVLRFGKRAFLDEKKSVPGTIRIVTADAHET